MEGKSNPRPQHNGSEPESPERAALEALLEVVVGAAYEVSNVLGAGFLEKLYERALRNYAYAIFQWLRKPPSRSPTRVSISARTRLIWSWMGVCSSKSNAPTN
jgi:hypothetical protein